MKNTVWSANKKPWCTKASCSGCSQDDSAETGAESDSVGAHWGNSPLLDCPFSLKGQQESVPVCVLRDSPSIAAAPLLGHMHSAQTASHGLQLQVAQQEDVTAASSSPSNPATAADEPTFRDAPCSLLVQCCFSCTA